MDKKRKLDPSYFDFYFNYLQSLDRLGCRVLHLGCGWDKHGVKMKFKHARVVSLDMDKIALGRNPNALKVAGDACRLSFQKESFHSIICEDLVEHIKAPLEMLKEIHFLLKKGGQFLFVTPNRWSYISVAATMTPLAFHRWYNRLRGLRQEDIYPTFYKLNSYGKIKKEAHRLGFLIKELQVLTGVPAYFNFSKILTAMVRPLHYLIRFSPARRQLGINIFAVLEKKDLQNNNQINRAQGGEKPPGERARKWEGKNE